MGTAALGDRLGDLLFGKTRRAVLGLLFAHADESFYLREIVRACGGGVGAVQRELRQLNEAGIVRRTVRGKQVFFQADAGCPVFAELKSLVLKTAGLADVLRGALATLSDRIAVALVYGSFAAGREKRRSDIDVLVVGNVTFAEVVGTLAGVQQRLRREINPTVFSRDEFRSKLARKSHFLGSVIQGPKIFLIGDARELERLVEERLADATPHQP